MDQSIYNSSSEDGLLKSLGPHRMIVADESFAGIELPKTVEVAPLTILGETKIYGTSVVGETHETDAPVLT